MSTKTLRKRIALIAVAALGAGILSVAPANAASLNEDLGTVNVYSDQACAETSALSAVLPVGAFFSVSTDNDRYAILTGPVSVTVQDAELGINSTGKRYIYDGGVDAAATAVGTITITDGGNARHDSSGGRGH